MLIEEIVRSCANGKVAHAAVASIGRNFLAQVSDRAAAYDMSVGAFTTLSVDRFLHHGDEGELRMVRDAMSGSQEPVLAGLHRILCITLASGGRTEERRRRDRMPRMTAGLCAMEADTRRDTHA
jgi:hypothetical protein